MNESCILQGSFFYFIHCCPIERVEILALKLYRKVGDHTTNMPATVWFGSGSEIKDSIKYKYDSCGNICEIRENGHIVAKYAYDSLNRLIREDSKEIGTTTLFTYAITSTLNFAANTAME